MLHLASFKRAVQMKNSQFLLSFIQNAIDGIITITERGIIESFNPSASRLFDYTAEEVLGKNISMLMPPPDSVQHDYYLSRYVNGGKKRIIGVGREVTGLKKNGEKFPFKLAVSEVTYNDVKYYVGFIHDLSEQKLYQDRLRDYASHLEELVEIRTQTLNNAIHELENAKEKLSISLQKEQELGKLKSRFVSMASHEFRTPLSTIQLSASLISKYVEPLKMPEVSRHIQKIKNSVSGLTSILTDFLQLENLESGTVRINYSSFDMAELAQEIAEEMQMLAKENQKINHNHSGKETVVRLDKNLVKNCIVNLINNAIKYSGETAQIDFNTEIADNYTITIQDNGIGIPLEDQKYLFDAFFRAQNTGNIPGTGLGLNIISRYVEQMNGKIDFFSNPEGTRFTLTFPKL